MMIELQKVKSVLRHGHGVWRRWHPVVYMLLLLAHGKNMLRNRGRGVPKSRFSCSVINERSLTSWLAKKIKQLTLDLCFLL